MSASLDDFYVLARACLVKDEQHFDRFDLAFGSYFKGVDALFDVRGDIPEEWLRKRVRAPPDATKTSARSRRWAATTS